MNRFFQIVIYGALIALVTGCAGCSMFSGPNLTDRQLIEAVSEAGCNLKSIKREEGEIRTIDCLETVRVVHER